MKTAVAIILILGLLASGALYLFSNSNNVEQPTVYKDLIQIDSPLENSIITNPVTIRGKARGNWYFEASFPVEILDEDGTVLWQGPIQAQGDWMTSEFVPFSQTITFKAPKGTSGQIIFHKDNPSGDPARDESVSVSVKFK